VPVILYSSQVIASNNIAKHLIETEFEEIGEGIYENKSGIRLYDTRVKSMIEIYSPVKTDYAIVLSPHSSASKRPSLTTHVPGNWSIAEAGGNSFTLNIGYGSLMRSLLLKLDELNTVGYAVSYEADHHGPTVDYPMIFVEVGSSIEEWSNLKACSIVGDAVMDVLKGFERVENFVGIGGGHYAPKFTDISLKEEKGFAHILPKYHKDIKVEMLKQAVEKSVEEVKGFIIDKKGLSGSKRKWFIKTLEELGFEYWVV